MSARFPLLALLVCLAACAGLAVAVAFWPSETAHGWLIGFLAWSSAPIGAVVLSLIHLLTGGRWGEACQPALRLGALGAALLPLFFLPIPVMSGLLYPWARDPTSLAPDVVRFYFNAPGFALRGLIALVGWAVIGGFALRGRLSPLSAGLALVFHGVAISLVAVDWGLSIAPHFTDSAFAAEIAVQQIAAALAATAVLQPERAIARGGGDLGGLLLATTLAAFYLAAMTFVVKWYGDQEPDAAWYLTRTQGPWLVVLIAALLLGAATPILGLSWGRLRGSAAALRSIGAATLAGIVLHDAWLVGPTTSAGAAIAALLSLAAMGGATIALAPPLGRWISPVDTVLAWSSVDDC